MKVVFAILAYFAVEKKI